MSVETLVRLDGEAEPLPLSDVEWAAIAPCGCTIGCRIADTTDVDVATREFWPVREVRERHLEDGYSLRLERRDAVMERMLARTPCPHDRSAWIAPIPPGHRWSERGGSRRRHLVPDAGVEVVDEKRDRWWISSKTLALCETDPVSRWRDSWGEPRPIDPHPTCRKCETVARRMAADGAS